MKDAAIRFYTEARACKSIVGEFAEKAGPSARETREEGTLTWIVYFISAKVPKIFGKHPPSTEIEVIDPREFRRGGFEDSGNSFHYFGEKTPRYVGLMIRQSDLQKIIESLRRGEYEVPPRNHET